MNKICLILTLLLSPMVASAQSLEVGDNRVTFEEILNNYSSLSGETVILDPRVKGRVTLFGQRGKPLSFEQLSIILNTHNYASYRSNGLLVVVPTNVIKTVGIPMYDQEKSYASTETITDVIDLEKLCPQDITSALKPTMPPTAHLSVVNQPPALTIVDIYQNIQRFRNIVTKLESSAKAKQECKV